MADNTLPPEGLSGASALKLDQRRAFLRRAVAVGVPVVLATVKGRSVLAQGSDDASISGCASMHPSGWLSRGNAKLREENCTQVDAQSITGDPLQDERAPAGGSAPRNSPDPPARDTVTGRPTHAGRQTH